ncbi:hypothetical protein [Bordetella avium]|uniref:hypothetical protein n=1 Tax=Bordetella avium TaxID=521 RepID=UPI000E696C8F|nr:hypothetical protein [Bordetella avium]AZY49610.1 hypothetical protein C0J09_11030 [Bordetella avium]RIQ76065.1 hypothetical protein D0835_17725 [Bordetella avium]RIQ78727.1 hypothetical protein D0837_17435 [Bordetella avium]
MTDPTIRKMKDAERARAAEWQRKIAAAKPKGDIQEIVQVLENAAIQQCKDEMLSPAPDNSDDLDTYYRYDPQQGYKAAHYARQDIIVVFAMAALTLESIRHLRRVAYLAVILLALILYKVW